MGKKQKNIPIIVCCNCLGKGFVIKNSIEPRIGGHTYSGICKSCKGTGRCNTCKY